MNCELDPIDIFTTLLGLLYIALEYRASIYLWLVGIVMPALDVWLYYSHGLYGDAGMAVYYTLAAVYGYAVWKLKPAQPATADSSQQQSTTGIRHMERGLYVPTMVVLTAVWAATYYMLAHFTNSTVPLLDGFTNALSIVALWALSRKYVEQWLFWIVADGVCCYLYVVKGIPFKALLYGLYVVIAMMGYQRWRRMAEAEEMMGCLRD